jgi:predicted DNA-binding WGR domain protein
MLIEQHSDEGRAVNALMKLAVTKKRRGYQLLFES